MLVTIPTVGIPSEVPLQGSLHAVGILRGLSQHTALAVSLLSLLVFIGVVLPAVWSSQPERRKAALEVLAHLLRRRP